jgi:hypothetical protein
MQLEASYADKLLIPTTFISEVIYILVCIFWASLTRTSSCISLYYTNTVEFNKNIGKDLTKFCHFNNVYSNDKNVTSQ